MKPDLDPDALERAARAVAVAHYTARFANASKLPSDEIEKLVRINVDGNWQIFKFNAEIAITAYMDALGLVTIRPLTPEDAKGGGK